VKAGLKPLIVWGGRLFLVVALAFVFFKVRAHWSEMSAWRPSGTDIAQLAGLAVFYGTALFLLAEGWHRIVNLFGSEGRTQTYASFTMTQVGKYLPGNVAHLVGKGLYLRGNSLSDPQIVKATLIELVIVPAGAMVCIAVLGSAGQLAPLVPQVSPSLWWLGTACLLAASLAVLVFGGRLRPDIAGLAPAVIVSIALSALFMVGLGATFAAVFQIFAAAPVALLAGASILAWLIGFLTPGAPGGIGVREAMLIAFLGGSGQEDAALMAAALFRIVTTLGDVYLLTVGWLLFRSRPSQGRA